MATTTTRAPRTTQQKLMFESVWAMREAQLAGQLYWDTIELLMTPNLTAKFQKMGYDFTCYARNKEIREDGQAVAEIDVFVENGEYARAVEVAVPKGFKPRKW